MDPYSAEGELINIHNHFHQGQYQEVVDFDTSSFSPENALAAKVLVLRARIALGQAEDVLGEVKEETEPELEAVAALAESQLGKTDSAVATIEKLAASSPDNVTVQIVGGTVLQAAGKSEEALALLSQHQGSCELFEYTAYGSWDTGGLTRDWIVDAVALIVQIHLAQNRTDLALKEVTAARRWAQDSLLVNLAESWVGLRVVSCARAPFPRNYQSLVLLLTLLLLQGGDKYQQSFYVFEELAQAPATSSIWSLVSQAVCELHLGRLEESQAALDQALKKDPEYAEAIANLLVLTVISGQDPKELIEYVASCAGES